MASLWRFIDSFLTGQIFVTKDLPKINVDAMIEYTGPDKVFSKGCRITVYQNDTVKSLKRQIVKEAEIPATVNRARIDMINGVYVDDKDSVYELIFTDKCNTIYITVR